MKRVNMLRKDLFWVVLAFVVVLGIVGAERDWFDVTGRVVSDLSAEETNGFIALCSERGCSSLPLTQYVGEEKVVLGMQPPADDPTGASVFGYHFVNPLPSSPQGSIASTVRLPTPEGTAQSIGFAGEGIEPIIDMSTVVSTIPSERAEVFSLLAALQLLTPQPSWISILSGEQELKGISLGSLSASLRTDLLTKTFGSLPMDGAVARFSAPLGNFTALYRVLPSGPTVYVLLSRNESVTFQPQYLVPFLTRGVSVPVPANVCLNGIADADEQCDLNSGRLENNPSCPQSMSTTVDGLTGTRDGLGSCSVSCTCVYDTFTFSAPTPLGTACRTSNDCAVGIEQCVAGVCRPKTYCGDGVVQGVNDEGQREQCDPAAANPLATIGWLTVGQCRPSVARCTEQCTYASDLLGGLLPDLLERCGDGIDNNCNGLVNEGCVCTPGTTRSCGSAVGQCSLGTQLCANDGTWDACQGETKPQAELCDGVDNNCNGILDEGLLNRDGTCGAVFVPEVCDLRDNDGDGQIDEAGVCTQTLFATPQTQVLRASSSAGPFTLIASLASGTRAFTDTTISPGTTYYYQLRTYVNNSYRLSEVATIHTSPSLVSNALQEGSTSDN